MAQQPSSSQTVAQLVALYALAEQVLLAWATRVVRRTTVESQQMVVAALRRMVGQVLAHLDTRTNPLIVAMVDAATAEGARDATRAVESAIGKAVDRTGGGRVPPPPGTSVAVPGEPFNLSMTHADRSAQAIRYDLTSELQDVRFRITRLPDDVYKAIAPHGGIYQVSDNLFTPAQAQAATWRVFTSQGITGFTDRSGRNWSMSAYTEMAVRTAAMRAYNDSHMQVMQAVGIDLFTVTDDGHPCPLCFPWQGRILSNTPDIRAEATIAEATAAGLWHPNCRHVLLPYLPGVTHLPAPRVWTPEDQRNYDQTQKQRRIELEIRKAKRAFEYALTPEAKADANADVRRLQARMRQFINDTGLLRQSRREQLNLTDQTIKLPTPIR